MLPAPSIRDMQAVNLGGAPRTENPHVACDNFYGNPLLTAHPMKPPE